MEQNGQVHTGHCTCMAGLGEACSHIAAVLFYLMASWDKTQQTSCTSQPCSWLAPSTKRKGQPLSETDFTNPLTKFKKGKKQTVVQQELGPGPSDTEKETFLENLAAACPSASILKVWPGYAQPEVDPALPLDMASLYDSTLVGLPISTLEQKAADVLNSLTCSEEQRDNAQSLTMEQSKCRDWFRLRVGRVTASNLKKCLATDPETPAPSVLGSVCTSDRASVKTPAIVWGKEKEEAALQEYVSTQGHYHEGFKMEGSGLWVCCEAPYMAGSPDGLVGCVCCGRGVVEVKCPYVFRDCTVQEFLTDKKSFMSMHDDGVAYLHRSHPYFYQVQAQMFVCDVTYCDFVVHTNRFTLIERVQLDRSFMANCLHKVKVFMTKAVLPQLMAHHFTEGP